LIAFFEALRAIPGITNEVIQTGAQLANVKLPKSDTAIGEFAKVVANLLMSKPEGQRRMPTTEEIQDAWKKNARGDSWINHNRRAARSLVIQKALEIKLARADRAREAAIKRVGGSVGKIEGDPKELPYEEARQLAKRVRHVKRGLDRIARRNGKSRAKRKGAKPTP
jgi:hypothetical protein